MRWAIVAGAGVLVLGLVQPASAGQEAKEIAQHIKDVSHEDSTVRLRAIRALGELGAAGRPAVDALAGVLTEDRDPRVRARAAVALGQIGMPALPRLRALVEHKDEFVRRSALEALARMGPEARTVLPVILAALKGPSPAVRGRAAEALGDIGADMETVAPLLVAALADTEAVRGRAAAALVKLGEPAIAPLRAGLRNPRAVVRYRCARVLAVMAPEASTAVPELTTALGDKEMSVRRMAAVALGEIGPDAAPAGPTLVRLLSGRDRDLHAPAADALPRLGPSVVEPVADLLDNADAAVRLRALSVLRLIGPDAVKALPAVLNALKDRDPRLRRQAALALGQMGPAADEAVKPLTALLDDKDGRTRVSAALALAQIRPNDPEGLERLNRELKRAGNLPLAPKPAAAAPVRQRRLENYLWAFVWAASPNFGIGLTQGAHNAVDRLGPDAIPALVRVLNRLATDPGKNKLVPLVAETRQGPVVVGARRFWFV